MNILVFSSIFPNNVFPDFGIFIKHRVLHFSKLTRNAVWVVAPVPYCPSWFKLKPWHLYSQVHNRGEIDGMDVHYLKYPIIPKISMPFQALSMFLASYSIVSRLIRENDIDLIDAHFVYPDGLAAVWLGKMLGKPVTVSARGSDIHEFSHYSLIKPMIKYAINHADGVISVCAALKNEMESLGIQGKDIHVIPNGIDSSRFYILGQTACRKRLSLPVQQKILLAVGSLKEVKGFDRLIQAMPAILAEHPKSRLFIIGSGPLKLTLEALIDSLNLQNHVKLVGQRPHQELIYWYNAADLFCLSSYREGWANVIMEAMACGCPVAATNVYGSPEILTRPEVGVLMGNTVEGIAESIRSALHRKWDRDLIRNHVSERDWGLVAQEVEAVFKKSIEKYHLPLP